MIGKSIIELQEIDSTNKYIKREMESLLSGTIVYSMRQISGYGRLQRTWHDSSGDNLAFSLYLTMKPREDIGLLTQLAAASVWQVLKDIGLQAKIKWPNDILVNDKKISGILIENIVKDNLIHIVVGIGININNRTFNEEIQHKATSIYKETNRFTDEKDILNRLISYLDNNYKAFIKGDTSFLSLCREHSYLIGKTVLLDGEKNKEAMVKDIDHFGRLVVTQNDEERVFVGSEVTLTSTYLNQGE